MAEKRFRLFILAAGVIVVLGVGLVALAGWRAWQATPAYQFREARRLWEAQQFRHYRLAAHYATNWAQCYYDIEVLHERIVHVFGVTCLSSATSPTLTISGIFKNFERHTTDRLCSSNGCYCEGTYFVRATYDPTWGYPQSITTRFARNWLDDLIHGQYRTQTCRRTDPVVERIEVVSVIPLR